MLKKLTNNYVVDNNKIVKAINKNLPLDIEEGMIKTLNYFNKKS